ncbi:MAG: hypothetical protein ABW133_17180 [Polyangiaceae bacterium]
MSEPRRFLDGDGTELEQLLLASGRAARPSRAARWKTEALVLLAGLGFASRVKAGTSMAPKATTWALAKYVAIGLGGGAAVFGATHIVAPARGTSDVVNVASPTSPAPRATDEVQPPSAARADEVKPADPPRAPAGPETTTIPRSVESAAERGNARAVRAAASPSASIGSEIQELERARSALAAGQPRAAVSALDRYQQTFPKGAMQQEALRLRVEAFALLGDRVTARSLVNRFETLYPNSPHGKRLHSLVDGP